jgi:hypothetical protein
MGLSKNVSFQSPISFLFLKAIVGHSLICLTISSTSALLQSSHFIGPIDVSAAGPPGMYVGLHCLLCLTCSVLLGGSCCFVKEGQQYHFNGTLTNIGTAAVLYVTTQVDSSTGQSICHVCNNS